METEKHNIVLNMQPTHFIFMIKTVMIK